MHACLHSFALVLAPSTFPFLFKVVAPALRSRQRNDDNNDGEVEPNGEDKQRVGSHQLLQLLS